MMSSTSPGSKVSIAIGNTIAEMAQVVDLVDRFGAAHYIPQAISNDLNLCLTNCSTTRSVRYDDNGLHNITVTLSPRMAG